MRSVRLRLLLSHLALVLILGVVMSSAISSFVYLGKGVDRVLEGNYTSIAAAHQMQEAVALDLLGYAQRLGTSNEDGLSAHLRAEKEFAAGLAQAGHAVNEPGESEVVDDLDRSIRKHLELVRTPDVKSAFESDRKVVIPEIESDLEELIRINQEAMARESDRAKASVQQAATRSMAIAAVALLFAVIQTISLSRSLLRPLRELTAKADELGAGKLDTRIHWTRQDELGRVASSFNTMAENLQDAKATERLRLERAKKMIDQALDNLYDPVIITDGQGLIIHLNKAAEKLFGPSPAAPRTPVIMHVGDKLIVDAIERVIAQDRAVEGEDDRSLIPLQVGEQQRTYRMRVSPMRSNDNQMLGTVTVLEDITKLKELDRLKTEFVGVAAHELRTPVSSLLMSNELLLEGAVGELEPTQREIMELQKVDLKRLERLMQELLDLTKMEAGIVHPKIAPIQPENLIRSAANQVQVAADERGVGLRIKLAPNLQPIEVDGSQIERVLINLANNGIRHTPEGGSVVLQARQESDQVIFSVADTGEGIPEAYLSKIFGRFVQVPGATGGGAGLGLAIAQNIVKAHGGKIWAESKLGAGSTFSFTLPLKHNPVNGIAP
jgi:NtrC-family two-component system sensor histidine kinase KinB